MAFPNEIVTFPTMMNISSSDAEYVKAYQTARQNQDAQGASEALAAIPSYNQKMITANYLNTLATTIQDVETFFAARYSPAYIVSDTQPATQEATDFWFEVTS